MRFAVDTGGTFTDLVVEDGDELRLFKSPTTPQDPGDGVMNVLGIAASDFGLPLRELLARGSMLVHGTTHAINAILTGNTARTALLATEGHRDMLLLREGGRSDPFNFTRPFPEPYIPRSLTFEVPGRIGSRGEVVRPIDEGAVARIAADLAECRVEAVAVCLLWSIANPSHELRVAELLDEHLPRIPYTLSHALNPVLREYRRASSTAIDASLKPLMSRYLEGLEHRLRDAGFGGRVLMVTSNAGVLDALDVAAAPIHSINSGPAMAPVAGRYYGAVDGNADTVVVADTGGTSYDVSLVRRGRIPTTRETWLGQPFFGHMTGFSSVDVKSIGAGGGSIASVDAGGLLHVGPRSAGSVPGPACYSRGGTEATLTDACVVMGFIDPEYFLGGAMALDAEAADRAVRVHVAEPLGLTTEEAASAILTVATEHMVRAIEEITIEQGIDVREAVLVGGGGAAGLNSAWIATRLGCRLVVIPEVGAALSAAGALMSDLESGFASSFVSGSASFDRDGANAVLADLDARCAKFVSDTGSDPRTASVEFIAEARYPHQVWELDLPLTVSRFESTEDVERMCEGFHALHDEVFAVYDPTSPIELVALRARVACKLHDGSAGRVATSAGAASNVQRRSVYVPGAGWRAGVVTHFESMTPDEPLAGPAIIESSFTTIVVPPGTCASRSPAGSVVMTISVAESQIEHNADAALRS